MKRYKKVPCLNQAWFRVARRFLLSDISVSVAMVRSSAMFRLIVWEWLKN